MKQVLLALAVCLASSGAVCAKEYRCDANGGVYYTSERVIDLPQDQNRWYVTVIGDPASFQFRQVTEWFETHPELRKLTQATHFSLMSTRSAMYAGRCNQSAAFAPPSLPCIRIQNHSGEVVYQVSGSNIPLSAEALVNSMQATCFRRRVQPAPSPSPYNIHYHFQVPEKEQEAVKPKDEHQIQDVFKKEASMAVEIPSWAYFVIGIGAVVAGVAVEWVKEYRKRA